MCKICFCDIHRYKSYLKTKEKAAATIEKYIRDATAFSKWLDGKAADKENLLEYKEEISKTLSPGSVNSIISSLNSLLEYCRHFRPLQHKYHAYIHDGIR